MRLKNTVRIVCDLPNIAQINHKTKEIVVSENFKSLTEEMKDFAIINLHFLVETETDYFLADAKTIDKIMELYPETNKFYWINQLSAFFRDHAPSELNVKRIQRLIVPI